MFFNAIKIADLIINIKGKKSGYRLTRSESKIMVLDIHSAFESEIAVIECLSENINCEMEELCFTNPLWKGLNNIVIEYFSNATLEDLVDKREF